MAECWDSDPDLDFDDSAFALSVPSESTTDAYPVASLEKRGSSAGLEDKDQDEDWGTDFDFEGEGIKRWKEKTTAVAGESNEQRHPFERTAESDATLLQTKEEENQSSTSSSRSGTLKGLLSSFSGLSLDSPTNETGSPFIPRSDSNSTFSSSSSSTTTGINSHDDNSQTLPSTPRPSSRRDSSPQRTPGPTSTLRHSSQLSTLLASATAGPGRVHHLGSTPQGAAKSVLGDWDEDLELDGLDARGLPLERGKELRAKASFASHISDDPEDDAFLEGSRGLPTPRSSRKGTMKPSATNRAPAPLRGKASTSDFTDQDDDEDFEAESDFELPDDIAQITLSPLLTRASNSSLNSHSRNSSQALQLPTNTNTLSHLPLPLPTPTLLNRAPSRHSTASPGLSMGGTTTDDEDEDDEAFFQEIVLPPYFLGGPGAMTPPSDGEGFAGGRIDLQGMLRRKLEARGGKVEGKGTGNGKLEGYREKEDEEDEGGEAGLVIEVGVKLGAERMRTRSGPKPPALKGRRTASVSNINAMTSTRPSSRPPPLPRSGSSTSAPRPLNSLSRSGSSTSLSSLPSTTNNRTSHSSNTSQPSPGRPSSAAGLVERLPRSDRRGPPPAPSTAARDRVRTRTASLRTTASNGDLRGAAAAMSTPAGARRPPRLDMTRDQQQATSTVLSPVPMTPSTPLTSTKPPTLRSRRSQGNLLATPSTAGGGGRTMERKRSLQALPKLEVTQGTPIASTPTSNRRPLRSPTPSTPSTATTSFFSPSSSPILGRTTTPSSSSRFAAPTASSISRVRERVSSNPVLPPSPLTSTTTSFSHLSHPPRPSSAASGRLLQPTASSAAKVSPRLPSSASFSNSPIAGLRIPSAALKLAKPKKPRAYGDGTELDGFDDLPLTKGERERERTVSQSMRRSSAGAAATAGRGAGGTVKPTAAERRGQNRSSGSAGSAGAKEGGSTIKAKPSSSRSASAGGSTIKASSKLAPPSLVAGNKRSKAESAEEGVEKKSKMGLGEKEKTKRKKEPQLIRNLGAPGMAKVGEMTWNPQLQRWEGNESVLRDFDKALSSSTRPALITQLSSGLSPARVGFPSLSKPIVTSPSESATISSEDTSATSPETSSLGLTPSSHPLRHGSTSSTLSAPNVKVVGSMVFDPIRMSWHSILPEGEDELDLAFEGGDWADDEGDGAGSGRAPSALSGVLGEDGDEDGWAMGEKERMLKNRASFVLSENGDGESDAEGQEGEVRRALRESCEEGERRCREEFTRWGWMRREGEGEEEEMRNDLWNIRELIMDNYRSPLRR